MIHCLINVGVSLQMHNNNNTNNNNCNVLGSNIFKFRSWNVYEIGRDILKFPSLQETCLRKRAEIPFHFVDDFVCTFIMK